jgi:hypothetical protein
MGELKGSFAPKERSEGLEFLEKSRELAGVRARLIKARQDSVSAESRQVELEKEIIGYLKPFAMSVVVEEFRRRSFGVPDFARECVKRGVEGFSEDDPIWKKLLWSILKELRIRTTFDGNGYMLPGGPYEEEVFRKGADSI